MTANLLFYRRNPDGFAFAGELLSFQNFTNSYPVKLDVLHKLGQWERDWAHIVPFRFFEAPYRNSPDFTYAILRNRS
ncbi:MAG: hypothetical protein HKK67_03685 [Chlorobiaceae bacterium]|nr:hypothetical protein [Chlorobiaceae bacterium]